MEFESPARRRLCPPDSAKECNLTRSRVAPASVFAESAGGFAKVDAGYQPFGGSSSYALNPARFGGSSF
jgi:hypothetical protein